MVTLTFAHTHNYGTHASAPRSGVGDRAYAWFQVTNPSNGVSSRREFALIDSGCDECLLNDALLSTLALPTTHSSVVVAGGAIMNVQLASGATIEIEGVTITANLIFGPTTTSIIGRGLYLAAFELAFTSSDWHHA